MIHSRRGNVRSHRLLALAALSVCSTAFVARAADVLVTNNTELNNAISAANPGDNIILKNGVWTGVNVNKQSIAGSVGAPITIRAQTPGQVAIAGSYFFDVGGHDYAVSGLIFKDENTNLKSIRFRGTNSQVSNNAVLMGGRYNQITYDVQDSATTPTSAFDHNFFAGKQDRGCMLVLDGSLNAHINNNFWGNRPTGGPSAQSNGWEGIRIGNSNISAQTLGAVIKNNLFDGVNGEAETISDKTQNNMVSGNTFKDITKGWLTARLGGNGTYEDNTFFNSLGIRVGNDDDTIADHVNPTIRNNYIEGPNAKIVLPGYQTGPTIQNNTVVVTSGSYNGATYTLGKYGIEYTNTTNGVISNNVVQIGDNTYQAIQAAVTGSVTPTATGGGNFAWNTGSAGAFASSTPTAIRNLFTVANPNLVRDASGRLIATGAAAGKGFQPNANTTVLTRASDVGASWMDPVMRQNKFTAADFRFDAQFSGTFSSQVENNGYLSTPAIMQNGAGTPTNLHTGNAQGVSAQSGDRAFDNRTLGAMGSAGGKIQVADRTWFRDLQAFTISGWFKTDGAQTIGGGATLMSQMDANGGWSLASTTAGKLTLTVDAGGSAKTATSSTSYGTQNDWVFFAVTFDARPSTNEVQFYVGTSATGDVVSAGQASISSSNSSDTVAVPLTIGDKFDGMLDNMRLFTARKDITWVDEDGLTYTRTGNNQDYAVLSLNELQNIRAYDLRVNQWNVDANGSWSNDANWAPDAPNGAGTVANFTKPTTAQRVINVDQPITVGRINFGSGSYSIGGASAMPIQLLSPTGSATISLGSVDATFTSPLLFTSNVTTTGGGSINFASIVNDGSMSVQNAAIVGGDVDGVGTLDVPSFKLVIARHIVQQRLQLTGSGNVLIKSDGGNAGTSKLSHSISIGSGGKLDLYNNDLIVGAGTSKSQIETYVSNGYANGNFNGTTAIVSTAAQVNPNGNTTLGVLSGQEYLDNNGATTFDGFNVNATDTLVKYTYFGDVDFNGVVDVSDYNLIDFGFSAHLTGWANGDVDYSGAVDVSDYNLIDFAFSTQNGTVLRAIQYLDGTDRSTRGMDSDLSLQQVVKHFDEFGDIYAQGFLAAVPEPSGLALGLVGCSRLLRRRRRSS